MSELAWHTETRQISDLIPHPANPRQLTNKQLADLTASLTKFDLAEIPVINTDNTILAGHQRLRVMTLLGRVDETVDVRVPSRELTKEEADEYLIRSNKNTGEWDFDELANSFNLPDLVDWGFSEADLGMSQGEEEAPEEFADPEGDNDGLEDLDNKCPSCGYEWNGKSR